MNKRVHIDKRSRPKLIQMGVFALVLGFAGQHLLRFGVAASETTLFLSPSSASVLHDANFSVEVRLDTDGEAVDGVEAILTYPDSQLQFVSLSDNGSAFGIGLPSNGGSGNISIRRVVNPDASSTVTGPNLLVATINMKARSSNGEALVSFTPQSRVTAPRAGNGSVLSIRQGGTYTISSLAVVAPPSVANPSAPSPPATITAPTPGPAPSGGGGTSPTRTTSSPNSALPRTTSSGTSAAPTTSPPEDISTQEVISPQSDLPPLAIAYNSSSQNPSNSRALPLFAKIAGILLTLSSLVLVVRIIFSIRQNHMVPAFNGKSSGSHSYGDVAGVHPIYGSSSDDTSPLKKNIQGFKGPAPPPPGSNIEPEKKDYAKHT